MIMVVLVLHGSRIYLLLLILGVAVLQSLENHIKITDSFYYHGQPSPIPTSALQLAGSTYLLRATAWEYYGRCVPASCYCQDLILVLALLLYISQLGYFHCLIGEWRVG
jgi:hypothetical protein